MLPDNRSIPAKRKLSLSLGCQPRNGSSSDRAALPAGYGITFLAGLLLASFLDGFYQGAGVSGRLIYYAYVIFFGTYSEFWCFSAAILLAPLALANLAAYPLYRRSRTAGERWFFLFLAAMIDGVVIFTAMTVLTIYFI
jgi:hypothetical protein